MQELDLYPYAFMTMTAAVFGVLAKDEKFTKAHPRIMKWWSTLMLLASMHLVLYPLLIGSFGWAITYMTHWTILVGFLVLLIETMTALKWDTVRIVP